MRSHQALYVSVYCNNGYLLPLGAMYYEQFDIVLPENIHKAKAYHVNIPPELIPSFASPFSEYSLFGNNLTQIKQHQPTFIRRLVIRRFAYPAP
ncbi:hypothetical protein ACQP3L_31400, partial [Escherichia coli]